MSLLKEYIPAFAAVFIVVLMALVAAHIVKADAAFSHAYLVYAAAADDVETAAYVPTATNNPLRLELNATLNNVLNSSLKPADRLIYARHGMDLLQESEKQIDQISPKSDTVDATIIQMQKTLSPGDALFQRGDPQKIIALAKERQAAINDIRALSYRADFETGRIFQHIIQAQGQLTAAYVNELNTAIPAEEEDFNKRQNRYNDLQNLLEQIQSVYRDFKAAIAEPEVI